MSPSSLSSSSSLPLPLLLSLLLLSSSMLLVSAELKISPEMRSRLNVPADAEELLIVGQSSHLDWDWIEIFATNVRNDPKATRYWYFKHPNGEIDVTDNIFADAAKKLTRPDFQYMIAEVAFLRAFAHDRPALWENFKNSTNFVVQGGAITTPDSLLPFGETYFRDYLMGSRFIKQHGLQHSKAAWQPDNFGHDSKLPSRLAAMDFNGVSFARLPGSCMQAGDKHPGQPSFLSAHKTVVNRNGGTDFYWESDGSQVLAYYMPQHYAIVDQINQSFPQAASVEDVATCSSKKYVPDYLGYFDNWLEIRRGLSDRGIYFVIAGSDFAKPVNNLTEHINDWNRQRFASSKTFAVLGQFQDYQDSLRHYDQVSKSSAGFKPLHVRSYEGSYESEAKSFLPTPYWTGYYSSRPALKKYHYETSRALVGAETMNALLRLSSQHSLPRSVHSPVSQSTMDLVWEQLVVSNHHDYITGTAVDQVYEQEQLPLILKATDTTDDFTTSLQSSLSKLSPADSATNFPSISIANPFAAYSGLVSVLVNTTSPSSTSWLAAIGCGSMSTSCPLQKVTIGSGMVHMVTHVDVPMHSSTSLPVSALKAPSHGETVVVSSSSGDYVLGNGRLTAIIGDNGMLRSLVSRSGHIYLSETQNPSRQPMRLEAYLDYGNIYRYGYEMDGCGFVKEPIVSRATPIINIVESGPLRAVIEVNLKIQLANRALNYTLTYTLAYGSDKVEISLTGTAPTYITLMVAYSFPDSKEITHFTHGTPMSSIVKTTRPYGYANDFSGLMEPVHDFVVPMQQPLASLNPVFYPKHSPSWAVTTDSVYGVLLRNTPGGGCAGFGADGSDRETHKVEWAVGVSVNEGHVGAGNSDALTLGRLALESQRYNREIFATLVNDCPGCGHQQPCSVGLVTDISPPSVIVTAMKMGTFNNNTLFVRLANYAAFESGVEVVVTFSNLGGLCNRLTVPFASALEDRLQISPASVSRTSGGGCTISFVPKMAINTLMLPLTTVSSSEPLFSCGW
eukprot:TRINITY_DN2486_c0_g1_i1.p1 TRINITY_DN2486_c0_g1~~TRINITY_DN2486_c0_g1_i1.p1  ORF type:complete len:1025 (+),score=224.30 TRINITY_DN2486_c0_g1_i1:36-3077(+)